MPNGAGSVIMGTGLRFLWISILVFILDQWTKIAIVDAMTLFESRQVLPFFNLTYVHNYGAAFSFLHSAGGWQRWFFTAIALGVSIMILWWLKQTPKQQLLLPIAFSFVLGGALGNVYDRIAYGYVIDFLDFYINDWHWPAFNIADSAIFIGAALLIIDMFVNKESNDNGEGSEK
ncbi:signal peptidase II [Alteromonas sediminis]|nr:signal peptidase II [Alteromonas sediminis]